jgi:bifunctional DNA-binding transcriptional regulator/antitoxin component of YhaV-PrlF toxin-antitoxin module
LTSACAEDYLYFCMKTVKARSRRRGTTRISRKNQITLPVEALKRAGLAPGTVLSVEVDAKRRLVLAPPDDPIDRYAGILRYPAGYLRKLRSEWRA